MKRLIILVIVLFTAIGAFVVNLPPREMRLKDLHPSYYPLKAPSESTLRDTAGTGSTGRVDERITSGGSQSASASTSASASEAASSSQKTYISVLPKLPASRVNSKTKTDSATSSITKHESEPKSKSKSDSADEYYIIVESLKTMELAQEKAEKLKKKFNMDFLVLPPTKEGYYRISCGRYATLDDARAKSKIVKTSIRPDVWIYSSSPAIPGSR